MLGHRSRILPRLVSTSGHSLGPGATLGFAQGAIRLKGGAQYGFLFEELVHCLLRRGGTFKVRQLGRSNVEANFKLPNRHRGQLPSAIRFVAAKPDDYPSNSQSKRLFEATETRKVASNALQASEDRFMVPNVTNFAAIDSFNRYGMYQVTCAKTHDIKAANQDFMALSGAGIAPFGNTGIGFFFCVPSDLYDGTAFRKQKVVDAAGKVLANGKGWHRTKRGKALWTQWALRIEV